MPTAFGKALILDLDRMRARLLQKPQRTLDIDRIAVTGIGIDDKTGIDAIADQRNGIDDFGTADQPDVRPVQPRVGDRRAGRRRKSWNGCWGCSGTSTQILR